MRGGFQNKSPKNERLVEDGFRLCGGFRIRLYISNLYSLKILTVNSKVVSPRLFRTLRSVGRGFVPTEDIVVRADETPS